MKRFSWAIRRELWENRWIWIVPASVAAVLIVGFAAHALYRLPDQVAAIVNSAVTRHTHDILLEPYDIVAGVMMGVGLIIAIIYCVDALYGERRDRSVLLWKSLPVSDVETVLAKLCIPTLVLPLIVWALTVAVHVVMLVGSAAVLVAHGQSAGVIWSQVPLLPNAIGLLYHLVALHGIASAPIYAWILLVSAWAPRAPLAWALLPPVAVGVLERLAFGTTRFAAMLIAPMGGQSGSTATQASGMIALMEPTMGRLLLSPAFWIGLAVAALFVSGAVRLRRAAQPI
ncbi:MAG: ABC transporter permease [Gemmatimonadaceae bacterium]